MAGHCDSLTLLSMEEGLNCVMQAWMKMKIQTAKYLSPTFGSRAIGSRHHVVLIYSARRILLPCLLRPINSSSRHKIQRKPDSWPSVLSLGLLLFWDLYPGSDT